MINGVNFQPGGGQGNEPGQAKPSQGSGVQEAIKVLSLRLPKVVGAQAAVPQALLQGSGGQGNRVDSVVNQVLSRIMPTGQPQQPPMPNMAGPNFSGAAQQPGPMPSWPWTGGLRQESTPERPWSPNVGPRIVIGTPYTAGTDADFSGNGTAFPPAMIDQLPPNFTPQPNFDRIGQLLGGYQPPAPPQEREETPLF